MAAATLPVLDLITKAGRQVVSNSAPFPPGLASPKTRLDGTGLFATSQLLICAD